MAARNLPAVSRAEMQILSLVWELGKATVQEVCNILPAGRNITYATVQTLLRRLEKKGYVAHELKGKAHLFSPLVKREAVIRRTVGDFVQSVFAGDAMPLMIHLAKHGKLKRGDLEQLKKVIKKK